MMFYEVLWCSMMFFDVLRCSQMFYDVLWYSMMYSVLRAFLVSFCRSVPPEFLRSFLILPLSLCCPNSSSSTSKSVHNWSFRLPRISKEYFAQKFRGLYFWLMGMVLLFVCVNTMALLWLYQLGGACMLGVRTYLAGILISWKTEHTRLLWQEGPIDNIKYKGTGKKV